MRAVVTTPEPGDSRQLMRDRVPFRAVEGNAIMALPPFDMEAPRYKIHLPSDTGIDAAPHGVGTNLSGQVHLQR